MNPLKKKKKSHFSADGNGLVARARVFLSDRGGGGSDP
jgi:hypothetical protein